VSDPCGPCYEWRQIWPFVALQEWRGKRTTHLWNSEQSLDVPPMTECGLDAARLQFCHNNVAAVAHPENPCARCFAPHVN
jgi:hypothetical protein